MNRARWGERAKKSIQLPSRTPGSRAERLANSGRTRGQFQERIKCRVSGVLHSSGARPCDVRVPSPALLPIAFPRTGREGKQLQTSLPGWPRSSASLVHRIRLPGDPPFIDPHGRLGKGVTPSISDQYLSDISCTSLQVGVEYNFNAMILAVGNVKGGVGKTTLAINLAIAQSQAGRDVLLVDGDEQGTSLTFTELRARTLGSAGYTAVALAGGRPADPDPATGAEYHDIIVDVGGTRYREPARRPHGGRYAYSCRCSRGASISGRSTMWRRWFRRAAKSTTICA